ncbi:hypothetical protein HRbin26_01704 [bacterium HR26]|nr:hypothetical protein HRbin26_01704 [bacterium HR26]
MEQHVRQPAQRASGPATLGDDGDGDGVGIQAPALPGQLLEKPDDALWLRAQDRFREAGGEGRAEFLMAEHDGIARCEPGVVERRLHLPVLPEGIAAVLYPSILPGEGVDLLLLADQYLARQHLGNQEIRSAEEGTGRAEAVPLFQRSAGIQAEEPLVGGTEGLR